MEIKLEKQYFPLASHEAKWQKNLNLEEVTQ
jgi:hypothetical protein